ncbi:T9SS type A sorting domain-containing protein [Hymenobacter glaciei]
MKHFFSGMRGGLLAGLLAFMLLALGPVARAQAPAWQSAFAFTQPVGSTSQVTGTATDANGSVYLTGFFVGTISFGNTTLISAGGSDVFVAKWHPATSSFIWAQRGGGTSDERATALTINGNNLYLTGYFTSATASFGSTTLSNNAPNNTGADYDVFVAKLTDAGGAGSFAWAAKAGGTGADRAYTIVAAGNAVYIGGSFEGTATFGSITLTSSRGSELFVAKLLDTGTTSVFSWVKQARSTDNSINVNALAVSGTSIYAAGSFLGATATLGTVTISNSSSNFDGFVAKLTDVGSTADFVWAHRMGGVDTDNVQGLAVRSNALYVSGNFLGTATFGNLTLNSVGLYDLFVAKLTDAGSSGSFIWVQRAGGLDNDYAPALVVNGTSLCVGGAFKGTADFGNTTLTAAGDFDVFAAKIIDAGSTGSFTWAQRAGGTGIDAAATVVLDRNTIYIAGGLTPPASFGNFAVAGQPGTRTGFLASLTDATLTSTTPALSGAAFTLSPNPARTSTTVQLPALPSATTVTLTVLDVLGRAVRSATVALPPAGLRHELSLTGLAPSLYVIKVQAGAATAARRLVVE